MPSAVTVSQIRTALIALLTAQMTPSGRLSLVKSVGSTSYPETAIYPYVGIKRIDRAENVTGVREFDSIIRWGITVVCTGNSESTPLSTVTQQLDTILDDGNNNGVEPILREIIQTGLVSNGMRLISTGWIKNVQYFDNGDLEKTGSLAQYIAMAAIEFQTRTDFILQL